MKEPKKKQGSKEKLLMKLIGEARPVLTPKIKKRVAPTYDFTIGLESGVTASITLDDRAVKLLGLMD
jgi:hypothetical protein